MKRKIKIAFVAVASVALVLTVVILVFSILNYMLDKNITGLVLALIQFVVVGLILILLLKYPTPKSLRRKWKVFRKKEENDEEP